MRESAWQLIRPPRAVPELYSIDYAQVDAAARTLAENADLVLGVKVRMSENNRRGRPCPGA